MFFLNLLIRMQGAMFFVALMVYACLQPLEIQKRATLTLCQAISIFS